MTTQFYISKLDVLKKYMDVWIEEKACLRAINSLNKECGFPMMYNPNALPHFETWYNMFLSSNN